MLKQKDFWIGLAIGVILYYLYTTKMQKPGKGGAA